jgi:hypothetical protein
MNQPPDDAALVAQNRALRTLNTLLEREIADHRGKAQEYYAATQTLDSEREANAILTTALEAKDRRIAEMREAGERLLLAMATRALRGRDHVPSMRDEQDAASAFRAALEPSDKGVSP